MNETITHERFARLVAEVTGDHPDSVTPDRRLHAFDLDSVRLVDLVISFEEAFGVNVTPDDLAGLRTVADLTSLLRARQGQARG